MVEYTTTRSAAPTMDGTDEAPIEESPLPAGAGDAEVDDDVDDENLDADQDDTALLCFHSMSDILATPGFTPHALVAGVYVDDLIITGSDRDNIRSFKEEMAAVFKMSDLGLLHYYLDIEVKQSASGILFSQGAYAMKILERSGMTGCNLCHISMEAHLKLSKQSTQPLLDATTYQSIVGSLRYLRNTRPDLAFAIGYVSHFLEEPREDHLATVKKILHYVADTCNWGLWFGQKKENHALLIGFIDADFARDVDVWKRTTEAIFFLVNSPIT
jgi:hypothetical protein